MAVNKPIAFSLSEDRWEVFEQSAQHDDRLPDPYPMIDALPTIEPRSKGHAPDHGQHDPSVVNDLMVKYALRYPPAPQVEV